MGFQPPRKFIIFVFTDPLAVCIRKRAKNAKSTGRSTEYDEVAPYAKEEAAKAQQLAEI